MAILGGLRIHSTPVGNRPRINLISKINNGRDQVNTAKLKRPRLFSIEAAEPLKKDNVLLGMLAGFAAITLIFPFLMLYSWSSSNNLSFVDIAGIAGFAFRLGGGTAYWLLRQTSREEIKSKVRTKV